MERPQIIKRFLEQGHQLSSDALDFLTNTPGEIEDIIRRLKQLPGATIVTADLLKNISRTVSGKKNRSSPEDYVAFFSERFEVIKNIFSKRLDLVNLISINKVSERTKKFSIIGILKEKDLKNDAITLEDSTGEMTILLKSKGPINELVEDEVLGVVCEKIEAGIISENILFPDIPMRREINKTKDDVYCLFISDIHMDSDLFKEEYYSKFIEWLKNREEKINVFVVGDVSSKQKDIEKLLSDVPERHRIQIIRGEIDPEKNTLANPSQVCIENVNILFLHNPRLNYYTELWETPSKAISILVKKRHLDPTFTPQTRIYDKDPYLLETIPDIIVAGHTHIASNANYKGMTILTTGSFISQPIFWLINLRTREIFKIDFS